MSSTDQPRTRLVSRAERASITQRLLEQAQTCEPDRRRDLLDEVVLINRSVAEAIARRYSNRGIPSQDLEQAAYEGLVKAVQKFDPSVRPDLLTYAVPTIRGEVQRHFRDRGWMVRPPRRIQEAQWKVSRSIERLSQTLGREPSHLEVSRDLQCTESEVREAVEGFGSFSPASLERRLAGSATLTLGDTLVDETSDLDAAEARAVLGSAMRSLDPRDQQIVYLRFFEERTQAEIGEALGVTQMQVSRLIDRILRALRTKIAA